MMRLELTTSTLARLRSTTELHPQCMFTDFSAPKGGLSGRADDETRTHDINLGKVALYH